MKSFFIMMMSCLMAFVSVGCASGGFKMTRKVAQFVNKQNILIRIILYIVGAPVYGIALVADVVAFNTVDFWSGRVSANTYEFKEGEKLYIVKHSLENGLRQTNIQVFEGEQVEELRLSENNSGQIEIFNNSVQVGLIDDIEDAPTAYRILSDGSKKQMEILTVAGI